MTGRADRPTAVEPTHYTLRLFVANDRLNSRRAKENLTRLCEEHLQGCYTLEIIDVLEDYQAALDNDVLVTPTLLVQIPAPAVRIAGDLSDIAQVLAALRLSRDKTT